MYRKTVLLLIIVLSMAILLYGVKIDRDLSEMTKRGRGSYVRKDTAEGLPHEVSEFEFTHINPENNLLVYRLRGENAYPHVDGTWEIVRPRVTFYSSTEENEELFHVSAKQGLYHSRPTIESATSPDAGEEATGTLREDVVLETSEGVRGYFEAADWSEETQTISAGGPIIIEGPDFRVYGEDLEAQATRDANEIIIRKNVRVVFDRPGESPLEQVFADEDAKPTGVELGGMVTTCDGVMSYTASSRTITFEEKVLVLPLSGPFSDTEAARERKEWLATIAAGEEAILNASAESKIVLFAGDSLTIRLDSGEGDAYGSASLESFTATGDVWLLRDNQKTSSDRVDYDGDAMVFAGSPARLWYADQMRLEGEAFRIDGATGEEEIALSSDKPGVLYSNKALLRERDGPAALSGETSVRWKDRFVYDQEAGTASFHGDVSAEDDSGTLTADQMKLQFAESAEEPGLESMTASGNVLYQQRVPERLFRADTIEYAAKDDTLVLTGGPNRLAMIEQGADVLESRRLSIRQKEGVQSLVGEGAGRLRYYEDILKASVRERALPTYDVRWQNSCDVSEKSARFEGSVKALQEKSTLASDVLEIHWNTSDNEAARRPRLIIATGNVNFKDLSQEEPLLAQGDTMTLDLATGVMELTRTTPYDKTLLNLPPEAMASFTFADNRLQGRTIYYLDDETGDRLLWTQRGGEVDVKRFDETPGSRHMIERTRVRCQGTILYAPPHRLVDVARRAKLPFGTRPMPRAPLLDPTEAPPSTGVLIFVDVVRLRREIPNKLDGSMTVELNMKCGYLEVHFAKPKTGASTDSAKTSAPGDASKDGSPGIAKMGAKGQIDIVHTAKISETTVKGTLALWRRDARREWIAEIVGDPHAEVWKDGKHLRGEKVKLWGYPAEVRIDGGESIGAVIP